MLPAKAQALKSDRRIMRHEFRDRTILRSADLGSCPDSFEKIFLFSADPNHFTYYGRLVPHEGRLAIVTDAERDAVDVDVPITNGADADGEDVWS